MSGVGGVGEVLGASTAVAAGVAVLPETGESLLFKVLAYSAITLGSLCLASFFTTRLLKKIF